VTPSRIATPTGTSSAHSTSAATKPRTMVPPSPIRTSHSPHRGERRDLPWARASPTVAGQPG
jgi:hypothetical protein